MKLHHRVLALLTAAALAVTLTACSPVTVAQDMVVAIVQAMGLGSTSTDDGSDELHAPAGGSITFPEGFETVGSFHTLLQDGALYIAFNDISVNKLGNTDYFTVAGSSVNITAYGSTDESLTSIDSYKIALWELSEGGTRATYVPGSTIYIDFSSDEACHTYEVTGLTAGNRYKATVSFDSVMTSATGGVAITGLTNDALVSTEEGDTASA